MSRSGRPARPPGPLPALPLLGSLLGVPVGFLGASPLEGYWQVGGEVVEVRAQTPEGGP